MRTLLFLIFFAGVYCAFAQDTTRLSLLFAGDVMGHDSQIASALDERTGEYDYVKGLIYLTPYVSAADIAIGNLEVTLAGPPFKGYPQFSSPDALASGLKAIGFDVLVTANNHSVDRGRKGIERTIHVLDSLGIKHTGTFVDEVSRLNDYPLMIKKNGFKLALLNYTYGTNGIPVPKSSRVNMIDTEQIRLDIVKAKQQTPDVIIAFMHWGTEYESLPRKEQKDLTDFCFSNGVDLVIGAHPHVIQPMVWQKDEKRLVVYSLGNFVSGQRKRYTDGGAMAYLELEKVRHHPDSVITRIDSASYILQWVYRTADANRDYYVLPVPTFEHNPDSVIADVASRASFSTFISDSRALYRAHNKNVDEARSLPAARTTTYKVAVPADPEWISAPVDSLAEKFDLFYGYEFLEIPDHGMQLILGHFTSEAKAQQFSDKLVAEGLPAEVIVEVH